MSKPFTCAILAVLLSSSLGACATRDNDRYPSLALRDVERIKGTAEPVAAIPDAPAPVAPSADLTGRLDQLRAQAAAAHAGFSAELPRTEQLVSSASGAQIASESWSVAQAALGGLEAARNPALIALAELDALYVTSEMEVGAVEAIEAARDLVRALVKEEDEALDRLAERLTTQ